MNCSHSVKRTDHQRVQYLHRLIIKMILCMTLAICCTHSAMAQESQTGEQGQTAAEASKEAANPLASVWLMQMQQNTTWIGMPVNGGNRVQSNLQFQPLISVKLSEDWSLVTRPVLQLFTARLRSSTKAGRRSRDRIRRYSVAFALSPGLELVGNWLLAAGPTFIFPTATDSRIGQNTWQVGPAAAIGYRAKIS